MNPLSVKLPRELHAALVDQARRRNVTRSALVRDILADALDRGCRPRQPSFAELAGDLVGSFRSGRDDLATDKRLLEEAMLTDAAVDRHR